MSSINTGLANHLPKLYFGKFLPFSKLFPVTAFSDGSEYLTIWRVRLTHCQGESVKLWFYWEVNAGLFSTRPLKAATNRF